MKPIAQPPGFVAPLPKRSITSTSSISVLPNIAKYPRPRKPLIIYEYESSPDCRVVRQACTLLDLTVEYRPCPGQSFSLHVISRFSASFLNLGARAGFSDLMTTITAGRRDVPFLVDSNPSMFRLVENFVCIELLQSVQHFPHKLLRRPEIFGKKEIVEYLFKTYGTGLDSIPASIKGGSLGGFFNPARGSKLRSNARTDATLLKPITLYGWEGETKFVQPVRETLTELGLSHIFVNCANGSLNR